LQKDGKTAEYKELCGSIKSEDESIRDKVLDDIMNYTKITEDVFQKALIQYS